MLLVYRQDAPEAERSVPLRGLRPGGRYEVRDVRTGASLGTFTAAELSGDGLPVALPDRFSAAVLSVDPV